MNNIIIIILLFVFAIIAENDGSTQAVTAKNQAGYSTITCTMLVKSLVVV